MGRRLFWPIWTLTLVAGWAAACGGTIARGAGGGTTTGSGGTPVCTSVEPPAPGPPQAPDGAGTTTFAITRLYLGDTDPDGTPDLKGGWKQYGYDLDGLPADAPGALCQPRYGAAWKNVHPPGCTGVDNGFGHSIVPILLGVAPDAPAQVDARFASGRITLLISVTGLGPGASYVPLASKLQRGGDLGAPPHLDGTDTWPAVTGTEVSLASGYLAGDTWVSGPPAAMTLYLPLITLSPIPLELNLQHAVLSMKLDPTHRKATRGVIAGVLSSADFVKQLGELPGVLDPDCCYVTCSGIEAELEQASDIMQDGTQDPTKPCDGISIGLGFDAELVQLGPAGPSPDPPPGNPCALDGG